MSQQNAKTVGQIFDERGPCSLMAAVVELAEVHQRIPVGHWIVDLGDEWELEVNGTKAPVNGIQPWESMMRRAGWPIASFNTVDGIVMCYSEDVCLAAIRGAIERKKLQS